METRLSELRFPEDDGDVRISLSARFDMREMDESRIADLMAGLRLVMYAIDPNTAERWLDHFGWRLEKYVPVQGQLSMSFEDEG